MTDAEKLMDVSGLVDEYREILCSKETVVKQLVEAADWTEGGAEHVHMLATKYGSFMLRSALALAIALGIEDGSAGF